MKIIPRASQKTDAMTSPTDKTVSAFFGADSPLSVHCFDCSFVSGVKWRTYVSSMIMNRRKKSALLLWNIAKHSIETSLRRCFCSIVSKRGIYFEHSFFMSKFSVNMQCTALFEMPIISASSRTFIRRSSNNILWIFITILVAVTSFGRPLRCSSWQLVWPRLNSATQYFIVLNEETDSPRIESNSAVIFVQNQSIVSHNDAQFFPCLQIHWKRPLLIAVTQILNK